MEIYEDKIYDLGLRYRFPNTEQKYVKFVLKDDLDKELDIILDILTKNPFQIDKIQATITKIEELKNGI